MHLSEHAGRFLQFAGGEPTSNLLRLVHPMLRIELRAALFRAAQSDAPVESRDVPVEIEGNESTLTLRVAPPLGVRNCCWSSSRETAVGRSADRLTRPSAGAEPAVRQLEQELEEVKAQLRDTIEQSEASAEELKASNEELQAMNEELRSATEELETGREELQSINEELSTVNQELKSKVEELARSNSDLQPDGVHPDRHHLPGPDLCIQRYTRRRSRCSTSSDAMSAGRSPISSRASITPRSVEDSSQVLATLGPVEVEVEHPDGRLLPLADAPVPDDGGPHLGGRADFCRHHAAPAGRGGLARQRGAFPRGGRSGARPLV